MGNPCIIMDTSYLFKIPKDREYYENLADLYSIFMAMENLEKAYIRDIISADDYTPACSRLIGQYRTAITSLGSNFNLDLFLKKYEVNCPSAVHRLVDIGVPATTEHVSDSGNHKGLSKYVLEVTQDFITLMDSLKLNQVAVDQIHPLCSHLMQSINKVSALTVGFEGRDVIREWLITLNKMKANDELEEVQVRQLLFDLENAYSNFKMSLKDK